VDTDPAVVKEAEGVFTADWAHQSYRGPAGALVLSPVNARGTLAGLITHARHSLEVYAEEVADRQLVADLAAAARRGVRVRMVAASAKDQATLRAAGVAVVIRKTPYIHAKAIVADNAAVFLGSENLSATSLDDNRELGLVLHDAAAITVVEQAFNADFGGAPVGAGPTPASTPATAVTALTPFPSSGAFAVRVSVQPNPTQDGTPTTVTAATSIGATCTVRVVYASGYAAESMSPRGAQVIGLSRSVSWRWTPHTSRAGVATAMVRCTLGEKTSQGTAQFTVLKKGR
jgi:hypothetical protein